MTPMEHKKRPLADVLWEAANKHLAAPGEDCDVNDRETYSCCAVVRVRRGSWALKFLRELGCDTAAYCPQMNDDQGTRYMWLLLAMHVAEDEGITV